MNRFKKFPEILFRKIPIKVGDIPDLLLDAEENIFIFNGDFYLPDTLLNTSRPSPVIAIDGGGKLIKFDSNKAAFDCSNGYRALLDESSSTNKNTNCNLALTSTSGFTRHSGDGLHPSIVDMTTEGIDSMIFGSVGDNDIFKLDCSSAITKTIYRFSGSVGNTQAHSFQCIAQSSNENARIGIGSNFYGESKITTTVARINSDNIIPSSSHDKLSIEIPKGAIAYIKANQLEEKECSTSLIEISGSSASRSESLYYVDITDIDLSSGFSTFFKGQLDAINSSGDRIYQLDNENNANRIMLAYTSNLLSRIYKSTILQAAIDDNSGIKEKELFKQAMRVTNNNSNAAYNGILGTADTVCNFVDPTRLYIGGSNSTGSNKPTRTLINRIGVYANPINDIWLERITR